MIKLYLLSLSNTEVFRICVIKFGEVSFHRDKGASTFDRIIVSQESSETLNCSFTISQLIIRAVLKRRLL